MARFWSCAARILKPGGTVALWSSRTAGAHPSVPNAAAINAVLQDFEEKDLLPYFAPGNVLTRKLYADLGLPWTVEPRVPAFASASFVRSTFGTDEGEPAFFDWEADQLFGMDAMEKMLGTMSPVTRWRQDHPEAVGTEDDVVRKMRRAVERLLQEAGVEKGNEKLRGGVMGVLMMVKKQA